MSSLGFKISLHINFEIFILISKIFLKIQYLLSQLFIIWIFFWENFNIYENNIISVEANKVVK